MEPIPVSTRLADEPGLGRAEHRVDRLSGPRFEPEEPVVALANRCRAPVETALRVVGRVPVDPLCGEDLRPVRPGFDAVPRGVANRYRPGAVRRDVVPTSVRREPSDPLVVSVDAAVGEADRRLAVDRERAVVEGGGVGLAELDGVGDARFVETGGELWGRHRGWLVGGHRDRRDRLRGGVVIGDEAVAARENERQHEDQNRNRTGHSFTSRQTSDMCVVVVSVVNQHVEHVRAVPVERARDGGGDILG